MIRDILETILNFLKSRIFILCCIFIATFACLIYRVFDLQIVNEKYYTNKYVQKAKKEIYTSGTRGNIYDSQNNLLAYNKLSYSIVIEDKLESSKTKSKNLNDIIFNTIQLITKTGGNINNNLPIVVDKDKHLSFSFSSDSAKKTFLINIFGGKEKYLEKENFYQNMSAAEVYDYLIGEEKYNIETKDKSIQDILNILSVRYNLSLNAYAKYLQTTIATNVSDETVATIYENEINLTGVSVKQDTIRVYNDSKYFSPIIGYTGTISEEQLAKFNSEGKDYVNSDKVGKAGIESSMEEYLQGTKGYQQLFVDSTGRIVSEIEKKDAIAGKDVYLNIDRDTQIATYNLLEQKIAGILISNIVNYDIDKHTVNKLLTDDDSSNDPEIKISIKEVYYQLINNNVVDINILNEKKSSENSKNIYEKYKVAYNNVIDKIEKQLLSDKPTILKDLDYEYQDYQYYLYNMLESNGILLTSKLLGLKGDQYKKYLSGEISENEFLKYCISNDCIDINNLDLNSKYTDTQDIYNSIVKKIVELSKTDLGFKKQIYYYMIGNTLSGSEICKLLFDQKIIDYNDEEYNNLSNGTLSSYDFIINQLKDLKITPDQIALDPCSGSVVITDPGSGKIISMVTYPSYDNNKFSGTVDREYWNKLSNDLSNPLYSRSTQTSIAPGSTFKMISTIAGLEEGVINTDTQINDTGVFDKVTPNAKCWIYPGAHGNINVTKALTVSCNFFFYEVGFRLGSKTNNFEINKDEKDISNDLGLEKLKNYASQFGLTQKSGLEITESEPHFSTDSVVRSAIGQGSHAYTNVNLARYVNTLANKGSDYELSLVKNVVDKSGKVSFERSHEPDNTVNISDSTWNTVYSGMAGVTDSNAGGTVGNVFKDLKYKVAGKTGTAQQSKVRLNHALFVCFAPLDSPKYAMSVIIPNADSSSYAAEVAHDVLQYLDGDKKLKDILNGKANVPTSGKVSD